MKEPLSPFQTTIVVLNWNQPDLTLACLESLEAATRPVAPKVIVVDNGSDPARFERLSRELIRRFPDVLLIRNNDNLGYAGGNNVGIRRALDDGAEAICILNNDIFVEPGFLEPLEASLLVSQDIGVVTPLVAEHRNDEVNIWALGSSVNRRTAAVTRCCEGQRLGDVQARKAFDVDVASGAAMLVRREVFEKVGLLDERFFLYYEETDWCLRVCRAGYRILAVPSAIVWHEVSASLGKTSPVIDYYMQRNHLLLIGRHWSGMQRIWLLAKTTVRDMATVAAYTIRSQHGSRLPNRNARLYALRDALLGRWGKMGADVQRACCPG